MQLTITEEAVARLKTLEGDGKKNLLLWYDTEELGCPVNGLPSIRLVKKIEPTYKKIDHSNYPTYVDEKDKFHFDQDLTLDFVNGKFRLSSPGKILNAFISPSSVNQG